MCCVWIKNSALRDSALKAIVKLFTKNTSVKIQKINLESAYDEAKRNPRSVYGLESLNILVGDYTSDGKQLKKLSDVKLTTVAEFLQSSRLS